MPFAETAAADVAPPRAAVAPCRDWGPAVLFAAAMLLAAYLAFASFSGGTMAGCGPASPCQRVLQSRWAYWFGAPVTVPAILLYAALMIGGWRRGAPRANLAASSPRWMVIASAVVVSAAGWFVFLQAAVLRAICPVCLAAHACATAGALLVLRGATHGPRAAGGRIGHWFAAAVGAALALVALLLGHLLVAPRTHAISGIAAPKVSLAHAGAREMRLYDGQFKVDLTAFPALGRVSAPHIAVSLFDYTCAHCRAMHTVLERTQREFGEELAVLLLPVPLDGRCNPLVAQTSAENTDACEYARLGLAVWRAKPEAFGPFHAALFEPARPPAVAAARAEAERLVGREPLARALADVSLDRQLRLAIDLFAVNGRRAGASQLPQLMLRKSVIVGPIHDPDTLRVMLRDEYGLRGGG